MPSSGMLRLVGLVSSSETSVLAIATRRNIQKPAFFIVIAVKTSNPTRCKHASFKTYGEWPALFLGCFIMRKESPIRILCVVAQMAERASLLLPAFETCSVREHAASSSLSYPICGKCDCKHDMCHCDAVPRSQLAAYLAIPAVGSVTVSMCHCDAVPRSQPAAHLTVPAVGSVTVSMICVTVISASQSASCSLSYPSCASFPSYWKCDCKHDMCHCDAVARSQPAAHLAIPAVLSVTISMICVTVMQCLAVSHLTCATWQ
jgi:hypothetical protein